MGPHSRTHMYKSFAETTAGGQCEIHGKFCERQRAAGDVHLAMQGLPCQPFSRMRADRRTPDQHQSYDTVFGEFMHYLEQARPQGWIVEEVVTFSSRKLDTGETYLEAFADAACRMGYVVEAVKMEASIWLEMERDRPSA